MSDHGQVLQQSKVPNYPVYLFQSACLHFGNMFMKVKFKYNMIGGKYEQRFLIMSLHPLISDIMSLDGHSHLWALMRSGQLR